MHVEDMLITINTKLCVSRQPFGGMLNTAWYRSFISSVTQHVQSGRPLSTNQARIVLKIIRTAEPYLVMDGIATRETVAHMLADPCYRLPLYESPQPVPREARYLGDNLLALRFKADSAVMQEIKRLATFVDGDRTWAHGYVRFDWRHKVWVVSVHHYNRTALEQLLDRHRFHCDARAREFLANCRHAETAVSTFTVSDDSTALVARVANNDVLAGWIIGDGGGVTL